MLCFAGCVPVANEDQATGETDGNVVARRAYVPSAARRAKLGSIPSAMKRSVSFGSWPSKPTMTTRRASGVPSRRRRSSRSTARNGQSSSERRAATKVTNATRNDDRSANPAPGPM